MPVQAAYGYATECSTAVADLRPLQQTRGSRRRTPLISPVTFYSRCPHVVHLASNIQLLMLCRLTRVLQIEERKRLHQELLSRLGQRTDRSPGSSPPSQVDTPILSHSFAMCLLFQTCTPAFSRSLLCLDYTASTRSSAPAAHICWTVQDCSPPRMSRPLPHLHSQLQPSSQLHPQPSAQARTSPAQQSLPGHGKAGLMPPPLHPPHRYSLCTSPCQTLSVALNI